MRIRFAGKMSVFLQILFLAATIRAFAAGGLPPGEENLDRLTISPQKSLQFQPGETFTFSIGKFEDFGRFVPVDIPVVWSVLPVGGVSIGPKSGFFRVDNTAPAGGVYEVKADVGNGRRVLSKKVYVYTPASAPLVKIWREKYRISCNTGKTSSPSHPINELEFRADGSFSVTWIPFEYYMDYWGSYTFDAKKGTLALDVRNGNYVPDDIHPKGSFRIEKGNVLVIKGIFLGSGKKEIETDSCGHVFVPN